MESIRSVLHPHQELTFIIKQDIANINKQIASLQAYLKQRNAQHSKSPSNKQVDEHNTNVVMMLQSALANTSMNFKDVLEVRTQVNWFVVFVEGMGIDGMQILNKNMKESKDRTDQFMSSTAAAATQTPASELEAILRLFSSISTDYCQIVDSLLFGGHRGTDPMGDGSRSKLDAKGKGRARPNGDILALDLVSAEEGHAGNQNGPYAQMQLMEQQVRLDVLIGLCDGASF